MARPAHASSEDTYDAILDVALAIVRESGPDACSLREVARRADVSTGTIQYYFENRAGLLEACLDHLYVWVAREVLAELRVDFECPQTACPRPDPTQALTSCDSASPPHGGSHRARKGGQKP